MIILIILLSYKKSNISRLYPLILVNNLTSQSEDHQNQIRPQNSYFINSIINHLVRTNAGDVKVRLNPVAVYNSQKIEHLQGDCIDEQDIEITSYEFNADWLKDCVSDEIVEEKLVSHLLKSNCLITNQPDWGTLHIHYVGKKIDHEKLLRYVVSFRQHNEFHEQCVERIFCDLMHYAKPEKLTVYARYTRRGGLDINPFRSNFENLPENLRLARQ